MMTSQFSYRAHVSNLVDITGQIRARTERAILFDDGGKEPVWLPLSQIEVLHKGDGLFEITLEEWLAKEKGLI